MRLTYGLAGSTHSAASSVAGSAEAWATHAARIAYERRRLQGLGARRSPDCSYIVNERIVALGARKRHIFWPICPDFVVELRSQTDRRHLLAAKMEEYMSNGAKLGWLIDPQDRTVTLYRPRRKPEVLVEPKVVEGEGPAAGLKVRTRELWWSPER